MRDLVEAARQMVRRGQYTVIGFYESTGETFADVVEAADPYSAMTSVAVKRGGGDGITILGAARGKVVFTPAEDESASFCRECGNTMEIGGDGSPGVSHHVDENGAIDYIADADHVAIADYGQADGRYQIRNKGDV